jgi:hypothetical protein
MAARKWTVEALMYGLRRGIGALNDGQNMRRLGELDGRQLADCITLLQQRKGGAFGEAWSVDGCNNLTLIWKRIHGHR